MKYLLMSLLVLSGCSYGNLEETKANAEKVFNKNGFIIDGYLGYQLGKLGFNEYGGAYVWYTLTKQDGSIKYKAALQRWGNEYHIYNLSAIDAVGPNQ